MMDTMHGWMSFLENRLFEENVFYKKKNFLMYSKHLLAFGNKYFGKYR